MLGKFHGTRERWFIFLNRTSCSASNTIAVHYREAFEEKSVIEEEPRISKDRLQPRNYVIFQAAVKTRSETVPLFRSTVSSCILRARYVSGDIKAGSFGGWPNRWEPRLSSRRRDGNLLSQPATRKSAGADFTIRHRHEFSGLSLLWPPTSGSLLYFSSNTFERKSVKILIAWKCNSLVIPLIPSTKGRYSF